MTRSTPVVVSPDPDDLASDGSGHECWTEEVHRLPFNSDSPAWSPARLERPAAEERMTRLVKTLESEVIPRLVEAHRASLPPTVAQLQAAETGPIPTPSEVRAFVDLVIRNDGAPLNAAVRTFVERGMAVDSVYLHLLAPAARHLGFLWEEDLCDFNCVTLATGRLQQLLQELSPAFGNLVGFPTNGRRVLLVPAPGEQHTFGLSMVAEFFVRSGWEVVGGRGSHRTEAVDMVQNEWFDVVGFSVGSEARLDWLKSCIAEVRGISRNRAIGVLVGGPIFASDPYQALQVGADGTASDGQQAPLVADSLVLQRVKRC